MSNNEFNQISLSKGKLHEILNNNIFEQSNLEQISMSNLLYFYYFYNQIPLMINLNKSNEFNNNISFSHLENNLLFNNLNYNNLKTLNEKKETPNNYKYNNINVNINNNINNINILDNIDNQDYNSLKNFPIIEGKQFVRIKNNGKKYYCCKFPYCNCIYRSKENLVLHFRNKHLMEKPYHCKFCGACFSHRNGKTYHERKEHTKIFPHKCLFQNCQMKFASKSALNYHLKHRHPENFMMENQNN